MQLGERSAWVGPVVTALLVAGLGVAINFATELKSNEVAWIVVGVLAVAVAAMTAISERRRQPSEAPASGSVVEVASEGNASRVYGLVMRRTVVEHRGKTRVETVTEYFHEGIALQSIREDSQDDGTMKS